VVRKDQLASEPSEFEEDEHEDLLSPQRLAEVQNGHPLTEAELRALRNQRLEKDVER
jgi:hypothetical protein